jgi:hypothetical protein
MKNVAGSFLFSPRTPEGIAVPAFIGFLRIKMDFRVVLLFLRSPPVSLTDALR